MKATFNFSAWQSLTQLVSILGYTVYELIIENEWKRTSANGIIVLLNSLNFKNLKVRNTSEKSEKISAKSKKLDEDEIMCNTLRSDRRRLITKHFLPFCILLNVGIDPNFPQKKFF